MGADEGSWLHDQHDLHVRLTFCVPTDKCDPPPLLPEDHESRGELIPEQILLPSALTYMGQLRNMGMQLCATHLKGSSFVKGLHIIRRVA